MADAENKAIFLEATGRPPVQQQQQQRLYGLSSQGKPLTHEEIVRQQLVGGDPGEFEDLPPQAGKPFHSTLSGRDVVGCEQARSLSDAYDI